MRSRPTSRRVRRATALAVGLVLGLASLTSCGGGGGGAKGGGGGTAAKGAGQRCPIGALGRATKKPVEITLWHEMPRQNEVVLKQLADEFNATHPDIHVNLVFQGTYGDGLNKYKLALNGGQLPDLYQGEDTNAQFLIDSGKVLPVQACVKAAGDDISSLLPAVRNQYTVGGTLWSMPFNVSNNLLVFNAQAFRKAGLDPARPPKTFADLAAASRKLKDSGAVKVAGFAFPLNGTESGLEVYEAKAAELYVDHENGRTGRATKAVFDNPAGKEYFNSLRDMASSGDALYTGNDTAFRFLLSITTGDTAMALASTATLGTIYTLLPQYANVTLGAAPAPGPTKGGVLVGGASLWISNQSAPEKQEAAYRFAKWLTETDQQARWHVGTGYLPISKAAADTRLVQDYWARNPVFKIGYDQLVAIPDVPQTRGPVIGPYAAVRDAVRTAIESMLKANVPPDQALKQAAADVTAALADYNRRAP